MTLFWPSPPYWLALLVAAVIEYRRGLRRDAKLMLAIGAGTSAVGLSVLWS